MYSHVVLPFLLIDRGLNAWFPVEKSLALQIGKVDNGSFTRNEVANALRMGMVLEECQQLRANARDAFRPI